MLTIEMTGKEDLESPWKIAIAGFAGAGKTLLSSTATKPLFVFFEENPRIKSIARRHVPHIKMLNSRDGQLTVQDQMLALTFSLSTQDHDYETVVIDTGDELFQKMKEARKIKNGGEFRIGDWEWIADAYREVVGGIIDLPMTVIFTFHLKSAQEGEEGVMVRELALQGAAKDAAAGWFDVVGVLDTFETADEQGDDVSKRVLLTHPSRTYPWVKDHSGQLPPRWALSREMVGDIPRLVQTLSESGEGMLDGQEHQVLGTIDAPEVKETKTNADVPTPEELQVKKAEVGGDNKAPKPEAIDPEPESDESSNEPEEVQEVEPAEEGDTEYQEAQSDVILTESEPENISSESGQDEEQPPGEPVAADEPSDEEVVTMEEATAEVEKQLGAETVHPCTVCGEEVEDSDLRELTQIRFREILCRPHFKEKLASSRS